MWKSSQGHEAYSDLGTVPLTGGLYPACLARPLAARFTVRLPDRDAVFRYDEAGRAGASLAVWIDFVRLPPMQLLEPRFELFIEGAHAGGIVRIRKQDDGLTL